MNHFLKPPIVFLKNQKLTTRELLTAIALKKLFFSTQAVEASPFCLQLKKVRKKPPTKVLVYPLRQRFWKNLKIYSLGANFSYLRFCQWVPNGVTYVGKAYKKNITILKVITLEYFILLLQATMKFVFLGS
ncbi:hypothetical protein KEM09_05835 [Carboxylicivirga mesophila]|uniref:GIY-YIG domain-containing protein n=1 Tax=Carboxylicivirga mesophila TaxID=1166478 RepID=A0ABS5K7E0_9BACT|nr:hypothetical protein [Carboxylicivirga mesophila]